MSCNLSLVTLTAFSIQFSIHGMKKRGLVHPSSVHTDEDRDVVRKFGRNTNIEGINNAGRAEDRTRLVIWLTIFLFLVALTLYDLTQPVQDYLSNPVDVSTTLQHENAIDFPSVTVCNRNIVSCKRLKTFIEKCSDIEFCSHKKELEELLVLGRCEEEKPPDFTPPQLQEEDVKGSDDIFERRKERQELMSKNKDEVHADLKSQNQSKAFISGQTFLLTYLKLNERERITIGHNIRDLIVSCTFRGVDCKTSLTTNSASFMDYVTNTTNFGNCYTLYTRNEVLGKSSLTGPEFGLSLVLNIQQSHYLKDVTSMAVGARVSVQDRQTFPLIEEYGVDLAPGSLTSLSLQMVKISRHEYTGCQVTEWSESKYEDQLSDQHKEDYRYSISMCQRSCVQQTIQTQCGCSHPMFETDKQGYQYCDLVQDTDQRDCVSTIIVEYDIGERSCECGPPCMEVEYEKLVSSTLWPSRQSTLAFSELYNVDPVEVKDDYLRLDVYFMSLNVKTVTETARYTLTTFISAIGGSLGVWVGFSVCMMFELLELLVDLGISCLKRDK